MEAGQGVPLVHLHGAGGHPSRGPDRAEATFTASTRASAPRSPFPLPSTPTSAALHSPLEPQGTAHY
jgi:hypothetical protein